MMYGRAGDFVRPTAGNVTASLSPVQIQVVGGVAGVPKLVASHADLGCKAGIKVSATYAAHACPVGYAGPCPVPFTCPGGGR